MQNDVCNFKQKHKLQYLENLLCNAPINVNPVGVGGGSAGKGWAFDKF